MKTDKSLQILVLLTALSSVVYLFVLYLIDKEIIITSSLTLLPYPIALLIGHLPLLRLKKKQDIMLPTALSYLFLPYLFTLILTGVYNWMLFLIFDNQLLLVSLERKVAQAKLQFEQGLISKLDFEMLQKSVNISGAGGIFKAQSIAFFLIAFALGLVLALIFSGMFITKNHTKNTNLAS